MSNQPRKHHYIPQFYLRGFTKTNSNDGKLYVFDKSRVRSWDSSPKNAAHQNDFYAIDVNDTDDRMFVEKELSNLEGKWSSVLRWVIENESVPADESFDELMLFVAFMYSRIPKIRNKTKGFADKLIKSIKDQMIATPESQKQLRLQLENLGILYSDERYKELISFIKDRECALKNDQSFHIVNMFEGALEVALSLSQRNWQIWKAKDDASDLICSDFPVSLFRPMTDNSPLPPLLASQDTKVIFPINRRIALVGMFEKLLPKYEMDENDVAVVNRITLMNADQLYSSEKNFVWTTNEASVGKREDLEHALKASMD